MMLFPSRKRLPPKRWFSWSLFLVSAIEVALWSSLGAAAPFASSAAREYAQRQTANLCTTIDSAVGGVGEVERAVRRRGRCPRFRGVRSRRAVRVADVIAALCPRRLRRRLCSSPAVVHQAGWLRRTLVLLGVLSSGCRVTGSQVYACGRNVNGTLGLGYTNAELAGPAVFTAWNNSQFDSVTDVSAGQNHVLIVTLDGSAWGVGGNNYGQLGQGNTASPILTPVYIPIAAHINAAAAGATHSLFLDANGRVWAVGANNVGQLGLNTTTALYTTPTLLPSPTLVSAIAAGPGTSYFVTRSGAPLACGQNQYGQLGLGARSATPTRFPQAMAGVASEAFSDVAAGSDHVMLLHRNGVVWTAGRNQLAQLGQGTNIDDQLGQAAPRAYQNDYSPEPNITMIAAGNGFGLAVDVTGRVFGWGRNDRYQLGDLESELHANPQVNIKAIVFTGTTSARVAVAAGYDHSVITTALNEVFTSGVGAHGELGLGIPRVNQTAHTMVTSPSFTASATRVIPVAGDGFSYLISGVLAPSGTAYVPPTTAVATTSRRTTSTGSTSTGTTSTGTSSTGSTSTGTTSTGTTSTGSTSTGTTSTGTSSTGTTSTGTTSTGTTSTGTTSTGTTSTGSTSTGAGPAGHLNTGGTDEFTIQYKNVSVFQVEHRNGTCSCASFSTPGNISATTGKFDSTSVHDIDVSGTATVRVLRARSDAVLNGSAIGARLAWLEARLLNQTAALNAQRLLLANHSAAIAMLANRTGAR